MTKADAAEIMDAFADGGPVVISESAMAEAAAVAARALRRSLGATKRAKKNAIRRRKEARDERAH